MDNNELVEVVAKPIYDAMRWATVTPSGYDVPPKWQEGGNSIAQDKAREAAKHALAATPIAQLQAELTEAREEVKKLRERTRSWSMIPGVSDSEVRLQAEIDVVKGENQRQAMLLKAVIELVPEPRLVSMGFDSPPEHATESDHHLGYLLFEIRQALALLVQGSVDE